MSTLDFTDFSLSIEDLPARARGLDEEATSDVLGGWGRAAWLRSRRSKMMKAIARRKMALKRKRYAAMKRRSAMSKRKSNPARRSRKKQYMAKASFHSRMASRFRAMARRA